MCTVTLFENVPPFGDIKGFATVFAGEGVGVGVGVAVGVGVGVGLGDGVGVGVGVAEDFAL